MVEDSPCTGDCRMVTVAGRARCRTCHRDYNDLEQWFYMPKEARLERMKQLENEKQNKK